MNLKAIFPFVDDEREDGGQATQTDTCSQHTRASRRGGHEQRRARSPSVTSGLPYTRFPGTAPRGPISDMLPRPPDGSRAAVSCPDNGSAFTARATRAVISGLGLTHRRGGYRDPESQAFIESWFSKLKERLIWRTEFETLDQAREEVAAYIDRYHDRPHSGLNYRTPAEVRQTWDDAGEALHKTAA